tara:strand:+ start:50864 stop:52186 length:1323 start_codon:yes stop_codon:yes gene_type:complete
MDDLPKIFQEEDEIGFPVLPSRNVLIHGPGGTGKTYLLRKLLKRYSHFNIAATSLTGISAIGLNIPEDLIYASTVHRWAGIGLGEADEDKLLTRARKFSAKNWRTVDILIIDEISMMSKELFKKLDYIAKKIRRSTKLFGGIRLILSGDFLQLSPIGGDWVFKSKLWKELNLEVILMDSPKRFTSIEYYELLQRVRTGKMTDKDINLLESRVYPSFRTIKKLFAERLEPDAKKIEPTILFSRRNDTKRYNEARLSKLTTELMMYEAEDTKKLKIALQDKTRYKKPTDFEIQFLQNLAPKFVRFKIDAQVMLSVNLSVESGLINGARGIVKTLEKNRVLVTFARRGDVWIDYHQFEIKNGEDLLIRQQIPLILSFANTIHKVQGATIDAAVCLLDHTVFADAQAYIALSRVRTIDDLYILKFNADVIKANSEALEFVEQLF